MADLSELNLPILNPNTGQYETQNFKLKDYYGGGGGSGTDLGLSVVSGQLCVTYDDGTNS